MPQTNEEAGHLKMWVVGVRITFNNEMLGGVMTDVSGEYGYSGEGWGAITLHTAT